jgi:hypothetical protein
MGAKQSGSTTTKQTPDDLTQQWRKLIMGGALGALGLPGMGSGKNAIRPFGEELQPVPGIGQGTRDAMQFYAGGIGAGNLGLGALSGDQAALAQLWNPYQQNVLDQVSGQFGDLSSRAANAINQQATQAGAFGGSRHGVASGIAQGEVAKGLGQQMAGLQYQGFNDAMGRAQGLANFGMGSAGQLAGLSDYERQVQMQQDPAMRQLSILQGILSGMPTGMTTTQPNFINPLGSLLGLGGVLGGLGWNPFSGGK